MKNRKIYDLGSFESFADVWRCLPHGGHLGDFIHIGNDIYVWNSHQHNWILDSWPYADSYHLLHQTGDLHLMGDLRVGGNTVAQQRAVFKNDVVVEGRLLCRHLQGHDTGFFATEERLREAVPIPRVGDWALVGIDSSPQMWQCAQHGVWELIGNIALENAFNLDRYNESCDIIDDMVAQGYVFAGVADTATQPHCPDGYRVFYITSQSGRYMNFDDIEVNGCSLLMWNPVKDTPYRGRWTAKSVVGPLWVDTDNIADGAVTLEKTTGLTEYVNDKLRVAVKSISVNGGAVHTPNILGHVNLVVGGGGSGGEDDPGLAAQVAQNTQDISDLKDDVQGVTDGMDELTGDVRTLEGDVSETKEDLRHTVVMLHWVQATEPDIRSAIGLLTRFSRGLYWLDTTDNTIYELQSGEGARFVWVKVGCEEALYVDAINRVLYVQVLNGLNTYDLVQIPSGSGDDEGSDDPDPGDEPGPEPQPMNEPFDYKKGNLGAYSSALLGKVVEEITETDIREGCTVGGLYPGASTGLGISSPTPHIWTEAEINAKGATLDTPLSLVDWDAPGNAGKNKNVAGLNNAALLRAVLSHEVDGVKTCIGLKLTKMYFFYVNHASSASYPASYKSNSINLPHDFVVDGEVDGDAVGGFVVENTMLYTEYSLNLRKMRLLRRNADTSVPIYLVTSPAPIGQLQVVGCDFDYDRTVSHKTDVGFYLYLKCQRDGSVGDNVPLNTRGIVRDTNCFHHIYVADNVFHGSGCVCCSDIRVVDSHRYVGNSFLDIETSPLLVATENTTSVPHTNCYMSCPMYIAGNVFRGKGEVFKMRRWNSSSAYCCAAVLETSVAYVVHNDIRDIITGMSVVLDPKGEHSGSEEDWTYQCLPETYDIYMNCLQAYYSNNVVRNIAQFTDYISSSDVSGTTVLHKGGDQTKVVDCLLGNNSGIFKAKSFNWKFVLLRPTGSLPNRDVVRHFTHNDYAIDCESLKGVWSAWWNAQEDGEYIHQPAAGADPDDDWGEDNYFYEKMHDKVINEILTGNDASAIAKILNLVVCGTTLTETDSVTSGDATYSLRLKEVVFSHNVVNAGAGGIAGEAFGGRWCANEFSMCGNTFVCGYITGGARYEDGALVPSGGWRVCPQSASAATKPEPLFIIRMYRRNDADNSQVATLIEVKDNIFVGMGDVDICPLVVYTDNAARVYGDRLRWNDNMLPSGAGFVYMYYHNGYGTVSESAVRDYVDYMPEPETEEPEPGTGEME